eukprot:274301_1
MRRKCKWTSQQIDEKFKNTHKKETILNEEIFYIFHKKNRKNGRRIKPKYPMYKYDLDTYDYDDSNDDRILQLTSCNGKQTNIHTVPLKKRRYGPSCKQTKSRHHRHISSERLTVRIKFWLYGAVNRFDVPRVSPRKHINEYWLSYAQVSFYDGFMFLNENVILPCNTNIMRVKKINQKVKKVKYMTLKNDLYLNDHNLNRISDHCFDCVKPLNWNGYRVIWNTNHGNDGIQIHDRSMKDIICSTATILNHMPDLVDVITGYTGNYIYYVEMEGILCHWMTATTYYRGMGDSLCSSIRVRERKFSKLIRDIRGHKRIYKQLIQVNENGQKYVLRHKSFAMDVGNVLRNELQPKNHLSG